MKGGGTGSIYHVSYINVFLGRQRAGKAEEVGHKKIEILELVKESLMVVLL